jgi:uncharacterized protein (DUF2147 family)
MSRRPPRSRGGLRVAGLLLALCVVHAAAADLTSPEGLWQLIDSSGRSEATIRIFQDHGAYFGRIVEADPTNDQRCTRCTDERKDRPYSGLVIIRNMKPQGDEYVGGDVTDPESGRTYGCMFKLINGGQDLLMRGFLGIQLLGRSKIWHRVRESADRPP